MTEQEINQKALEDLYWQSFRAEAAKDILTGIVAHNGVRISSTDAHGLTKLALIFADELVKQLKENNYN